MRTSKQIRMAALAEATRPRRQYAHRDRIGTFAGWLGTRGFDVLQLEAMADAAVDAWHNSGPEVTEELHEWLGLSWEEYSKWASGPAMLCNISALLQQRAASTIVDM